MPQTMKPVASGRTVPSNCRPMAAPMTEDRPDLAKFWNEEATPAVLPKGCIAIELKLAPVKPTIAIEGTSTAVKDQRLSHPASARAKWMIDTRMKKISADWETRRAPKRMTIRELVKLATDIAPALMAKI